MTVVGENVDEVVEVASVGIWVGSAVGLGFRANWHCNPRGPPRQAKHLP